MVFEVRIIDQGGKPRTIQLQAKIFRDDDGFWNAYIPALDLSSCGESEIDAKRMIKEAATIFLQECSNMGTLDIVLKASSIS